jgi:hypothetical protein
VDVVVCADLANLFALKYAIVESVGLSAAGKKLGDVSGSSGRCGFFFMHTS